MYHFGRWLFYIASLPCAAGSFLYSLFCSWTSDESTRRLPKGWRGGLRNSHDMVGCYDFDWQARSSSADGTPKRRKRASVQGGLSELFEALDLEDIGEDNGDIDPKVVKKAYRELSIKFHPDKQSAQSMRFNQIRDAYEILSDPVKMLLYDTGGMDNVKKYERGEGLEKTASVDLRIDVDLADVYIGAARDLSYQRRVVCRSCREEPRLRRCRRCSSCPDELEARQVWMNEWQYYMEEVRVPSAYKCTNEQRTTNVQIERGMISGDRIRFEHLASQLPKKIPGDVAVAVHVKRHPIFRRIQNDLVINVRVSLHEALLGFERELSHLDGHIVRFGVPRGTVLQPGYILQIEGEGMPLRDDPSNFGRLLVSFDVVFPDSVPSTAFEGIKVALERLA